MENRFMNIEERIEELLSKMTLHEKVGQLHQVAPSKVGGFEIPEEEAFKLYKSGDMDEKTYDAIINHKMLSNHEDEIRKGEIGSFISVMDAETANHYQKIAVEESRLGIPLIFGLDVIHGFKTMFPIPLAESCSFDDELFEETARVAAKESAAGGVNWTYAPMVDVARDSRWGRVAEGAGEDTYLASCFSRAKVRGFQGKDLTDEDRIAACVKHFAAYGAVEGGCDYDTVDMSMPKFFETYYPPYEVAVKDAGYTIDYNSIVLKHTPKAMQPEGTNTPENKKTGETTGTKTATEKAVQPATIVSPKTGDTSAIPLYTLVAISAAGACAVAWTIKRKSAK